MFTLFRKMFRRKDPLKRALQFLEESSNRGNTQAQQMLSFDQTLQVQYFSPMHENASMLNSDKEKINLIINHCLKKKPIKIKKVSKKISRNPNKSDQLNNK